MNIMIGTKLLVLVAVTGLLWSCHSAKEAGACRVDSESLKKLLSDKIEELLDVEELQSIYWQSEPLDAGSLGRAIGINVTSAETHFELGTSPTEATRDDVEGASNATGLPTPESPAPLVHDLFVTCSVERDRTYSLLLNVELNNPFEVIDVKFASASASNSTQHRIGGYFRIHLSKSTFLVNLRQRFKYDECLSIKYVQLAPNSSLNFECVQCDEEQQEQLNGILIKRMVQLNAELDSLLSEKLLIGLQVLLSQQRLELDSFLE